MTCGEYLQFMSEDAYARPELWLSTGWDTVNSNGWHAPLYWQRDVTDATGWRVFTLRGWTACRRCSMCQYATLASSRPTPLRAGAAADCRLKRNGNASPARSSYAAIYSTLRGCTPDKAHGDGIAQLFGDCWEWTASPYVGYPGYQPLAGALGEYNGKFMCGQMVLRGGSCVTPANHLRATYRNFFQPATRWQFSGLRLAM